MYQENHECKLMYLIVILLITTIVLLNPLSAGDAFKRIHTVFPQLKFDRN